MRASDFEYRHQTLLHVLLAGLALLTYLIQPDDLVWASVRHHSDSALLERITFGMGAAVMLSSAMLDTWAGRYKYVARMLFALALGLLLPWSGSLLLIGGESVLVLRLVRRDGENLSEAGASFRAAFSKWGLAASMIVFTFTLQDRIPEIGAAISFVIWLALNRPAHLRTAHF